MIREDDIRFWVLEAREHPESAPAIIQELARRLVELDAENERLRDEIVTRPRAEPRQASQEQVQALVDRVATLQALLREAHPPTTVVLVSDRAELARLESTHLRAIAAADEQLSLTVPTTRLRAAVTAHTTDDLILVWNTGRGTVVQVDDAPIVAGDRLWTPIGQSTDEAREWVSVAANMTRDPRFRTIVTRRGFVRQHIRVSFDRAASLGQTVFESPLARDEPRAVVNGDLDDLVVITRWGAAIRFPQRSIPPQGALALGLGQDDEVVAAVPVADDNEILIVTGSGSFAVKNVDAVARFSRPGGNPKPLVQAFDVVTAFSLNPDHHLLAVTFSGRLTIGALADLPPEVRDAQGYPMLAALDDPLVIATLLPAQFAGSASAA